MNSISDILKFSQSSFSDLRLRLSEVETLSFWESIVGPAIAKHAVAYKFENQKIYIRVSHPIWSSELLYQKTKIIEKLNEKRPKNQSEILDLIFV